MPGSDGNIIYTHYIGRHRHVAPALKPDDHRDDRQLAHAHHARSILKEPLRHLAIVARLNLKINRALNAVIADAMEVIEDQLWFGCHIRFERPQILRIGENRLDEIRRAQLNNRLRPLIFFCYCCLSLSTRIISPPLVPPACCVYRRRLAGSSTVAAAGSRLPLVCRPAGRQPGCSPRTAAVPAANHWPAATALPRRPHLHRAILAGRGNAAAIR